MHAMDNAKVMETLEKYTLFTYFEKLINVKLHKVVIFSIFPYTGAPNLSDPHYFVLVDDLDKMMQLNGGCSNN